MSQQQSHTCGCGAKFDTEAKLKNHQKTCSGKAAQGGQQGKEGNLSQTQQHSGGQR